MQNFEVNIINIFDNTISKAEISVNEGRIFQISLLGEPDARLPYVLPGFVDAHVHIESSMMTPCQFGRMAVVHGTVATVSDPHEIANVLGVSGVEYMIENGSQIPFKFYFGAPSCVPATAFETAGAKIDSDQIKELLNKEDIVYLAEMMNFPGVINKDTEVLAKINYAKLKNKPVDGHAPGLKGKEAVAYFSEGISTDHECFTFEEAENKLKLGVKILIREGSAAKNFEALIPLAEKYSDNMMFCSDDKHPDDLENGHINELVKRAIKIGIDPFKVLRMASLNVVKHYNLNVGLLREGEHADFILIDNLKNFNILATYINGNIVAEKGKTLIESKNSKIVNNFKTAQISNSDIDFKFNLDLKHLKVIKINDGQLVTEERVFEFAKSKVPIENILLKSDILKIVVYNRYQKAKPAVAFIKGFGIKNGAIASSVAHDSHNIIAVGTNDEMIVEAINLIVNKSGGVSAVSEHLRGVLPLPIAGLMSEKDGYEIAKDYQDIDKFSKETLVSKLKSPFMSLSFMALLVIPSLKISDLGLFDGNKFEFVDIQY